MTSRSIQLIARSTERVLGRRHLARLARVLADQARLDVPNGMDTNGELEVQAVVVRQTRMRPLIAIDVGANRGQWSEHLLRRCDETGTDLVLHAFEPSAFTFGLLVENLGDAPSASVSLVNQALSNEEGSTVLYQVAPGAGSNSMHHASAVGGDLVEESVRMTTLDSYCAAADLDHVDIVKIDAEGHDLLVLDGASRLLYDRRIGVVQFEYNWRWIDAGRFLKDAFELLEPLGYRIGKVTPRGIEIYATWHPELETFREGNYVAMRADVVDDFHPVTWWNSSSARQRRGTR